MRAIERIWGCPIRKKMIESNLGWFEDDHVR